MKITDLVGAIEASPTNPELPDSSGIFAVTDSAGSKCVLLGAANCLSEDVTETLSRYADKIKGEGGARLFYHEFAPTQRDYYYQVGKELFMPVFHIDLDE